MVDKHQAAAVAARLWDAARCAEVGAAHGKAFRRQDRAHVHALAGPEKEPGLQRPAHRSCRR